MSVPGPRRLNVVDPGDVLSGVAPVAFERGSKLCVAGDVTHRGLLRVAAQIAEHGLRRIVAPSGRATLVTGLGTATDWATHDRDLKHVRRQRSECYSALAAIEATTLRAVRASVTAAPERPSPLEAHADTVVWRYLRLAVRLAVEAVVLTLDGVTTPAALPSVIQHVAAARAYQTTALGAARQPEFRLRAEQQAALETDQLGDASHAPELLALQIFHEYLGVRWKVLHDAERAYVDEFVSWALSGSSLSTQH
ncbi:MAG TPA: hypothetical protein VI197_01530 [Polyangiaceae bacterium]